MFYILKLNEMWACVYLNNEIIPNDAINVYLTKKLNKTKTKQTKSLEKNILFKVPLI